MSVSSRTVFLTLGWLPIDLRIVYFTALLTFKALNGLAPVYLTECFHHIADITNFNTRNASQGNLYLPSFKTVTGQRSFSFRAVTIWNTIPPSIRNSQSVHSFKVNLRGYLLTKFRNDGSTLD